jgi:hypothetical protein
MKLSEVGTLDLGCIIDGSHWNPQDFEIAILRFAINYGYDDVDMEKVEEDYDNMNDLCSHDYEDFIQALWEESELAVNWMNDQLPENYYFYIDDGSLYLTYEEAGYHD